MTFPEYFNNNSNYKILKGDNVTCVEYFHQLDTVKNIHLDIEEVFFVYVKSGEIKLKSPKETYIVKAGRSAIVNNGTYIMSESLSEEDKSFKAYLFFLSKETLKQFHYRNLNIEKEPSYSVNNILIIDQCDFLDQLTSSISLFFNGQYSDKIRRDLIDLKSLELLHYLSINTLCSEVNNVLYAPLNDDNYKLKNTIKNSYLNNLSIEEYAALCNMSLSNFKRRFQTVYNTSPAKWIKNQKLEHSLKLLESGNYKINQIAYECGFNNPKTYRRLFKEKYKVLPSAFLKTQECESF